jgi:hypothetical protein
MPPQSRRANAFDLLVTSLATIGGLVLFVHAAPTIRSFSTSGQVVATTVSQALIAGAVPLLLMWLRKESFGLLGFSRRGTLISLATGIIAAVIYDASVSVGIGELAWAPFSRHHVFRLAGALASPWNIIATVSVVIVWGILEGFFAVYYAAKVQSALGPPGNVRWAGALAFGTFNALTHLIVGQRGGAIASSFLSGVLIPAVPALTGNAWGGVLVQVLTNAVGRRR